MRKRFFIGTALSVLFMGFPMIEPATAETTPEDLSPATDSRKPHHAGGFIRFNGFRHSSGKSVTYPGLLSDDTGIPSKSGPLRPFDLFGHIEIEERARIIDYPILSVSEGDVTAFQLSIPYDEAAVEILGATTPIADACMAYHILDNELQLRWTRRTPTEIHKGDTLAFLKLYLKHKPNPHIDRYFHLNPVGFNVTHGDVRTDDWRIALPAVSLYHDAHAEAGNTAVAAKTADTQNRIASSRDKNETMLKQQGGEASRFEILSVIPNPMKSWADITYSIFGECTVRLRLYSLLGEEVMTIVNSGRQTGLYRHNITVSDVAAGVYILRLETCQENVEEPSDIIKVVIQN